MGPLFDAFDEIVLRFFFSQIMRVVLNKLIDIRPVRVGLQALLKSKGPKPVFGFF